MSVEIRCILIPLDFSHHAEAILEWGAHLAEEHKSRVLLLHAYLNLNLSFLSNKFHSNFQLKHELELVNLQ